MPFFFAASLAEVQWRTLAHMVCADGVGKLRHVLVSGPSLNVEYFASAESTDQDFMHTEVREVLVGISYPPPRLVVP